MFLLIFLFFKHSKNQTNVLNKSFFIQKVTEKGQQLIYLHVLNDISDPHYHNQIPVPDDFHLTLLMWCIKSRDRIALVIFLEKDTLKKWRKRSIGLRWLVYLMNSNVDRIIFCNRNAPTVLFSIINCKWFSIPYYSKLCCLAVARHETASSQSGKVYLEVGIH